MEITSPIAFLVSGVSLAVALVTVSLNVRAARKTDLEILKLKRDLAEASSRIYVPTSEEISGLMELIKISEETSRNFYDSAKDHINYMNSSNKQSLGIMESSESLEGSIRSFGTRLSSLACLLEEWIYMKKIDNLEPRSNEE
jgi:hypothetical protein